MSVKTLSYARKPFYVDAVRVDAENMEELTKWTLGEQKVSQEDGRAYIHVNVHRPVSERQSQAYVGDWILSSKNGFKVYTNQAFKKAFDPAEGVGEKVHRTTSDLVAKHGKPVPGDRRKRSRQPEISVEDVNAERAQEAADEAAVTNEHIDRIHGKGASEALDAAIADGSIFSESSRDVDVTEVETEKVVGEAKANNRREWLEKNEDKLNTAAQQELFALRQNDKEN